MMPNSEARKLYRQHTQTRSRFVRVISEELATSKGKKKVCKCMVRHAIEFAQKYFHELEKIHCDWNCDNEHDDEYGNESEIDIEIQDKNEAEICIDLTNKKEPQTPLTTPSEE